MPRVDVPVTSITRTLAALPAEVNGDSVNNHSMVNDGKTWLEVRNAHATIAKTVTIVFSRTVDGQTVTSRVYSLPAVSTTRKLGPWPVADYGSAMSIDVESADVKLNAYRLGA